MKGKMRYVMTMIAVCGLVGCSMGICFGTSGLFYNAVSTDLNISKGSISMTYTIAAMASAFSGLFIGRILRNEKNLKPLIIAGVTLCIGGTALLSLADRLYLMYACSVIRGIGAGLLSFVMATMVINQWFLARNGVMISVAMSFSGLPGVLLSGLFTDVIASQGWRFGYLFISAVMVIFCLPALLYPVRLKPSQVDMEPYGYQEYLKYREENPQEAVIVQSNEQVDHHSMEMIFTLLMTIMVYIIAGLMQHLPSLAASIGLSTASGALMVSFASAANIVSKILYGAVSEKKGPFITTTVYALLSTAALVVMLLIHEPLVMAVAAFVFGFTFANSSTAISIIVRKVFGMDQYTKVYPLMSFAGSAANAASVGMLGFLYDITGTYATVLIMCIAMQAVTLFCTANLAGKKK